MGLLQTKSLVSVEQQPVGGHDVVGEVEEGTGLEGLELEQWGE